MLDLLGDWKRTKYCGNVGLDDVGNEVILMGWVQSNRALLKFARDKHLMEVEYVSLNAAISSDPENPTVFDVVGGVSISEGETLFDIVRWDTQLAGSAMSMNYRGQAIGHLTKPAFSGQFQAEYEANSLVVPMIGLKFYATGVFEVKLDDG